MKAPSFISDRCFICGQHANNRHHMVKRSAGELYIDGHKLKKPTITLCGSGTTGHHGLAHQNRLHFRWIDEVAEINRVNGTMFIKTGHLEYLITDEPTNYIEALNMEGWQPLPKWSELNG